MRVPAHTDIHLSGNQHITSRCGALKCPIEVLTQLIFTDMSFQCTKGKTPEFKLECFRWIKWKSQNKVHKIKSLFSFMQTECLLSVSDLFIQSLFSPITDFENALKKQSYFWGNIRVCFLAAS